MSESRTSVYLCFVFSPSFLPSLQARAVETAIGRSRRGEGGASSMIEGLNGSTENRNHQISHNFKALDLNSSKRNM